MKEHQASRTARAVALARALATAGHGRVRINDPYALRMLPSRSARVATLATDSSPRTKSVSNTLLMGMIEHIALRTRAIDEAVRSAYADGARQLVLLGAGLDTRAHRLDLHDCRIFEVDHPATQTEKIERARDLPRASASLMYVPVDFVATRFDDALREHGYNAREKSIWIWEGVSMYLPTEVVHMSLEHMAAATANGSVLAMTYVDDWMQRVAAPLLQVGALLLRAVGEPLHATFTRTALDQLLTRTGFQVESDDNDDSWLRVAGEKPAITDAFRAERLVVAKRQS